jgi:diguanylate cyclase (GGDEF)-like protein
MDVNSDDGCIASADKIINTISKPFLIDNKSIIITISVGIAKYNNDVNKPEELIKRADDAMYVAKKSGKNGYRFYL